MKQITISCVLGSILLLSVTVDAVAKTEAKVSTELSSDGDINWENVIGVEK